MWNEEVVGGQTKGHIGSTSVDKALSVCETLSAQPDGMSGPSWRGHSTYLSQPYTGYWHGCGRVAMSVRTTARHGTV